MPLQFWRQANSFFSVTVFGARENYFVKQFHFSSRPKGNFCMIYIFRARGFMKSVPFIFERETFVATLCVTIPCWIFPFCVGQRG